MPAPGTRITAGSHRGRPLRTRPGRATRPTTALVRQALFNIIGESIRGARVLDLFAGFGTLGLEALSRGAATVTFVDGAGPCATIVAENLAATGFTSQADVADAEVTDWLRRNQARLPEYNLIILDPPYHDPVFARVLSTLDQAPLRPSVVIVAEHHRRDVLPELRTLHLIQARDYGATRLTFLRGSA